MAKTDNIPSRNLWLFGQKGDVLMNKPLLIDSYFKYMMNKSIRMFEWKNLPETIPVRELELLFQICRFVIFTKVEDKYFVFYGGLGGQPNEYYQPTQAIVSNPYLRFSSVLNLDDYIKNDGNACVGWNDSLHIGLYPLNNKYASLLAETDITLKYVLINMRFNNILTADDDNTKDSIKVMFDEVANGTGWGIITTKRMIDESSVGKVETSSSQRQQQLKDLIEVKQYLMGSWLNDLGLNANYNMKREAINESEADLNEDSLLPMIDDMLFNRKKFCDEVNKKFNLNIEVELSSSWKKIRKEIEIREESQQEEANADVDVNEDSQEEENVKTDKE